MRKRILLTSITAIILVLGLAFLSNQLANLVKTEETTIKASLVEKTTTAIIFTTPLTVKSGSISENITKPITNTTYIVGPSTVTTTEVITVTKIMPKVENMVELTITITITKTMFTETSLTTRNFTTVTLTSG